jgi:hypothetical protein
MSARQALAGLGLLALVSCGGHDAAGSSPAARCPDLHLNGHDYVAYRTLTPPAGAPGSLQEVGDATYPACNVSDDPFHGHQSTDVWHLPGAGLDTAVLGFRQGTTDVFVVYVRQGIDPASLHLRSWAAR